MHISLVQGLYDDKYFSVLGGNHFGLRPVIVCPISKVKVLVLRCSYYL